MRKQSVKAFAGALFLTLAFAAAILVTVLTSNFDTGVSQGTGDLAKDSSYAPHDDEAITVAVLCFKNRGGALFGVSVLRFDPVGNRIALFTLPYQTVATVNIKTGTLRTLYTYGGSGYVTTAVENVCGIQVNRYLRIDLDAAAQLVNLVGGMAYDLPEEIAYTKEDGETVHIPKGSQSLDGRRVAQVLTNPKSYGAADANLQTALLAQLIRQHLNAELVRTSDNLFAAVVGLVDTNLTSYDYHYRKSALLQMAQTGGFALDTAETAGEMRTEAKKEPVFTPAPAFLENAKTLFGG